MGPHEQKLREAVGPAAKAQVDAAQREWDKGQRLLDAVATAIKAARDSRGADSLGDITRDQAKQAFDAMHARVQRRAEEMREAATALRNASVALGAAERVRDGFDANGPLTEPAPPNWSPDEIDQIKQMKVYNAQVSNYNAQYEAREAAALEAKRQMDETYRESTATMQKVHGDKPSDGGGDGGGNGPGGKTPTGRTPSVPGVPDGGGRGGTTHGLTPDGGTGTDLGDDHGDGLGDEHGQDDNDVSTTTPTQPPGLPQGPTTPTTPTTPGVLTPPTPVATTSPSGGSTAGGVAAALGGGLLGGAAGIGGAVRGGTAAVPTGSAAGGNGRSIGSTTRTGASGALTRGATGTPSSAGSTTARSGAAAGRSAGAASRGASAGGTTGRGAGSAGAAGGRGQAGGRGAGAAGRAAGAGAGAGAASRGGRRTKDQRPDQEFFEDVQDWVDDEGVAPSVLD